MKTFNRSVRGLEKYRGLFFQIGLIISLLITFLAFEWRTPSAREEITLPTIWDGTEEILMPVTYRTEEIILPEPEPEKRVQDKRANQSTVIIIPDDQTAAITIDSASYRDIIPIPLPVETDSFDSAPSLMPEIWPEFPGGDEALVAFLKNEIKYPEKARKDGLTGAAYISFVVDENGNATDITCKHATHPTFGAEAIRVVSKLPVWKPGQQGGKKVKVIMTLPVTFRLL